MRSHTSNLRILGPSVKAMRIDKESNPTALRKLAANVNAHCWTRGTCGVALGLCGGFLSGLVGSLLTAISWVTGPEWNGFHIQRYGTVLLFLVIPLLIFGGHCLDLVDKHDAEARKRCLKSNSDKLNSN